MDKRGNKKQKEEREGEEKEGEKKEHRKKEGEKIKVQSYRSKRAPKLRLRIKPALNYRMFRKVDNC